MIVTAAIRDLIADETRTPEIKEYIVDGREQYGMQSFDQHLMDLVGDDVVLRVATVTKLTRNIFLAAVIPLLTWMHVRSTHDPVRGARNIAGIVATNTTIARPQTNDAALQKIYAETGGLSGKPLRERSTEVIRHLFRRTRG